MAVIDPSSATDSLTLEGFEGHYAQAEGWTIGFETYTAEADPAPLFAGLPDDACQCLHLGYVIEGAVTYNTTDGRSETVRAGQAYAVPAGHRPVFHAGSRVVEFSPTADLEETLRVVMANLEAAGAS